MDLTLEVYKSRGKNPLQRYRWRARASNGRIVASSGEGFEHESHAHAAAEEIVCRPHPEAKENL